MKRTFVKPILGIFCLFLFDSLLAQNLEKSLFNKVDKNVVELRDSEKSRLSSVLNREITAKEYEIVMFNGLPEGQGIRLSANRMPPI